MIHLIKTKIGLLKFFDVDYKRKEFDNTNHYVGLTCVTCNWKYNAVLIRTWYQFHQSSWTCMNCDENHIIEGTKDIESIIEGKELWAHPNRGLSSVEILNTKKKRSLFNDLRYL